MESSGTGRDTHRYGEERGQCTHLQAKGPLIAEAGHSPGVLGRELEG